MIKMNVTGLDSLTKLATDLKGLKTKINSEEKFALDSLHKNITVVYERNIYDLVYDQYDPEVYKRTHHLLGGHGAKDEQMTKAGYRKSYDFSINEDSTDPVDGTTWREKADKIENGAEMMTVGFNRPFIEETQKALEWENLRTANEFERSVNSYIDRIIRG